MYGDYMKQKKTNYTKILFLTIPLLAFVLYVLKLVSGYNNSDGAATVAYNNTYPLLLFGEYALITLLFIPFITNAKKEGEINLYILPLMLFSALGMMRIDAVNLTNKLTTSSSADYGPSVMLIIFFITLLIMFFSKHGIAGAAGTLCGALIFPAYGICFAPFVAAAAFLYKTEKKKEHTASVILNGFVSTAAFVYAVIRLEANEFSFDKKYVPVIILVTALAVFFAVKKEYKLLPLASLPLFPLAGGIFFTCFPTPVFTLAGSVAALVLLLGTVAVTDANEKIKGYALSLVHNPVAYIITSAFILHTAALLFVNPGYFRDVYMQ